MTTQQPTAPVKEIVYDPETRDFALYLDGELTGFARSYQDGETVLDDLITRRALRSGLGAPDAAPAALVGAPAPTDPNALVALAVAAARGAYEPTAEELAEVAAWDRCPRCGDPRDDLGRCSCDYRVSAARVAPAPVLVTGHAPDRAPIVPTLGMLEAALLARQAEAEGALRGATVEQDRDGVKIARRSAQAYRDAIAIAYDGSFRALRDGGVLVKSRSRAHWHTVTRAAGASPACTCEWRGLGPCAHVGFFEGWEDAIDLAIEEADAASWSSRAAA